MGDIGAEADRTSAHLLGPSVTLASEARAVRGVTNRPVRLFLAPIGAGADERRLIYGPFAITDALGDACGELAIDVVAPPRDLTSLAEESDEYARLYHLMDVRVLSDSLAARVEAALAGGELPVVVGGDHTVAIGGFSGVRRALGLEARVAIVWIDAHPDLNTPDTTPSNHGHGMPLAALLGHGHPLLVNGGGARGAKLTTSDAMLVGARSIDPGEALFLAEHPDLLVASAQTIREEGLANALGPLLARARGMDAVYLSFDLDAVDPTDAPGVTTPVPHGLSAAEAVEAVRRFCELGNVVAGDVVEYLPARDLDARTARLAAELIEILASMKTRAAR